jgi:hypothetical protein
VKLVVLAFNAGMLNHGARIGLQTGHCASNVPIYLDNFLDGRGFQ